MDGDHRLAGAGAKLMNDFGDEFLTGAAFALQEHGRPRGGHLLDNLEDRLHGRGFADDIFQAELRVELLTQRDVFYFQILLAQGAGDAHLQLVNLQAAFGDVIVGAAFHGFDGQFLRAVGGHEDADGRPGQRLGAGNELHPVLAWQPEVGEEHVEAFPFEKVQGRLGIFGEIHVVMVLERGAQAVARGLLVVHDEQGGCSHAGSVVHRRFQEARPALVERQPDAKAGPASDLALELNAAAMGADDALNDHQAQAGAFLLGGEKGVEDAVELFLGDAAAGVGHADPDAVSAFTRLEGEGAAFAHGLHGVFDEIDQHLLDLGGVKRRQGQLAGQARFDV